MNAQRTQSLGIPVPLVILALLAVADGITTHIGLAFGVSELNPLFAALFAANLLSAWAIYAIAWATVLGFVWWAYPHCGRRWWLFCVAVGIIGKGGIVVWNTAQLALLWWLLA